MSLAALPACPGSFNLWSKFVMKKEKKERTDKKYKYGEAMRWVLRKPVAGSERLAAREEIDKAYYETAKPPAARPGRPSGAPATMPTAPATAGNDGPVPLAIVRAIPGATA